MSTQRALCASWTAPGHQHHPGIGLLAASGLVGHILMDGFAIGAGFRAGITVAEAHASHPSRLTLACTVAGAGVPISLLGAAATTATAAAGWFIDHRSARRQA